jgi:hypothetical protein
MHKTIIISSLAAMLPLAAASPLDLLARDSNPGCQASSQGNFSWTISQFDYHASYVFTTPAHQNSWGYVDFNLTSPALAYPAVCSAASDQLEDFFYGTQVFDCLEPDRSTTATTFTFNRANDQLNVTQHWVCSDEDPQYP